MAFNESFVRELGYWHSDFSLFFFTIITNLGDFTVYLAILCCIYFAIDKNKGYQLVFIVVFSSVFNSMAKILIANPRPPNLLHQVEATGYSTPSGHAQISASFGTALALKFRKNWLTYTALIFIFLIGFSRPFLGVHYLGDILLGWALGVTLSLVLVFYWDRFAHKITKKKGLITIFLFSMIITVFWGALADFGEVGENIATYNGLFFGLVGARALEQKYLKFSALSTSILNAFLKTLIGFALTCAVWLGFSEINSLLLGEDATGIVAYIFRYIRYCLVAFSAVYLAPLVLVKLRLAQKEIHL